MLTLFVEDWRDLWGGAESPDAVGAVFTKPEIVSLILDLVGYLPDKRLIGHRLLEPSSGDGAFLTEIVRRVIASEVAASGVIDWAEPLLDDAIVATDISLASVTTARSLVASLLVAAGCPGPRAKRLATKWVVQTDFLLADWPAKFDFIVGNPPYVRLEQVPKQVMARYRQLFATATDRADLYVAFIERGLQLLAPAGVLGFICANRFTKNKYGEALRRLIAHRYHVRYYINLEHTQPFFSDVSAYPAIIVLDGKRGKPTRAATLDDIEEATLACLRKEALGKYRPHGMISQFQSWYPAGGPWLTTSADEGAVLTKLNGSFPTLELSGPNTRVGIGVATGADSVFVLKQKHEGIEESRQIPLLMSGDIGNDVLRWSGHYLLNPFADADDGSLADLPSYPGMAQYLSRHREQLLGRHVAKARPKNWYRTIDRIWPQWRSQHKLVIPDIQSAGTIGYDRGEYYPHHNIYWITSDSWPLLALKTLLRSSMVYQQVRAYSVQMRGGSLRFQAQTLRKLRLPAVNTLRDELLSRLEDAANSPDQHELDALAHEAFQG